MLKNTLTLFYICFLTFPCFSQAPEKDRRDTIIAEIDFQKGFKNDTVSLKVNNVQIFEKKVLLSIWCLDFTDVSIGVYSSNHTLKPYFEADKTKDVKNVKGRTNRLQLELTFRGKAYEFNVDLIEGKYIGVYIEKGIPEIRQSDREYLYD